MTKAITMVRKTLKTFKVGQIINFLNGTIDATYTLRFENFVLDHKFLTNQQLTVNLFGISKSDTYNILTVQPVGW